MRSFIFSQYLRSLVKVPLHWVLVVPFVLQTVGAVGLVGYFSYRSGQEAVEDLAKRLLAQVSERVSDRLDRYLQTSQQIVAINLLAVKQGSLNIKDFEQLQQHLWEQMKLNPSLTSNGFWSTQGEAIGYGRIFSEKERYYASKLIGKNLTLGKNYIIKINKLNPSQRQFYRIDDRGKTTKLIYSKTDLDFRQLPWYRQAKTSRKQIWSSISVNRIIPVLQIQALAPIYNNAGKFQGVFRSIYFLSDLSSFLHKQKFSRSGQVLIIEHSGNLVTSSNLENLDVKQTKEQPKRLLAVNSLDTRTKEVARKLINKLGSFDNLRDSKQLDLVINNQQHFVQVTPYQDNYGLDWLIVVIVPKLDFMASINENLWRTIGLCGLTFLGTTAAGILSAYYIAKPIRRLSRSSQALAAGNWQNVEQEDSTIKEISVLAQSFNSTAEQMQQSFEQIKTALQESEARFTKVFRTCPDPISINQLGDGGKYLEVNDSFLQFSEYSREEIVGRTPEELNFSAAPQQNAILWEELQQYGRIEGFEFHYRTKSGKLGTALLSIELVELDGQQRVLTISKDISDRKQLELALQSSQAQLNDILNSAIAAISSFRVSIDNNWEINYISAGCEFISGYTSAELQADKNLWVSRIFPGDWDAIASQLYADIFAQQTGTYEYRLYHQNGSLRWISQTNTSRWDEILNCWIVTAVSLDITEQQAALRERKQAQEALRQNEERFQQLVAASPGVIYTVIEYPSGPVCYEYLSPAFEEIHEIPVAEVLHDASITFNQIHPDDRDGYQQAVKECLQTGKPFKHEWRIITPSGKTKWIQANSRLQRRENGELAWHGVVTDISEQQAALSERKQALEALRQSEERFQEIAHTVNQFFFVRSLITGEYLYVSPAYEKIWHRCCESLYQNPDSWLETIHPEDRELVLTSIKQQSQEQTRREYRIIRPGGEIRWISAEVSVVKDEAGKCLRVVGLAKDITDRQQAEWELRQQKELRETIFNESTDAIFLVDPQTLLIFDCNRRAVELFEVESKTELIGKEGRTFQRHPFTSKEIDEITQQMQQKGFWSAELEYISRQGNSFWANIAAKPVKIANQWINLIRLTDISDRKRIEAALRESEERFRRAFDDAAIGMALVALDGRFLQVNIALCEITGYSEAELLGNFFQDITHPDDSEKDLEYIRQVLAGKCRTYQMEKRYIHKSGHLVWGLLSVSVVKDQQGNCLYFVTQIQDISERHKIDRIKDEFISIVSHELRTPLTAIRGSLGILESGVLDNRPEKAQYMLQVAVKNSDRLVRLVNDILDLERLESGKVKLVMGKCQVEDLMQQAIESVQAIAHQAQIKLELTPLVAEIWASSDTIIQALTNLLSNAIKFSPPHSTIWLSAERQNSEPPTEENPNVNVQTIPELLPNLYILFQVRDQGRGIPAEKLETIFGRFQQVDLSDSRQKGGTGLGLAICKSIVQQHGGQIWVESVLGQGSTFYFTLPIKSQEV